MSSVVKIKVIKPQRLKEKEMRLELLNALRKVARDVEKDYKETTKTWEHKPEFETIISLRGGKAEFLVGTSDLIYKYVDEGTRPHRILPVKAKRLRFFAGGTPKTTPGVLRSGSGSRGSQEVFSEGVMHPGTKPRNFSKLINAKQKRNFTKRMVEGMRKAAEKSGNKA